MRFLPPNMAVAIQSGTIRPVWIGMLDFKIDPAFGWTGPGLLAPTGTGDPDLDGNIFASTESAVEMSSIAEDTGIGGAVTMTFSAHANDAAVVRQIVADRRAWQGRRAKLWMGLLAEDEATLISDPIRRFSGYIVEARMSRAVGEASTIQLTLDQDLGRASGPAVRWLDHAMFEPGDAASSFINDLANGPIAGVSSGSAGGGFVGGGGGRSLTNKERFSP